MMDLKEAIESRHSVRRYTGQEVEPEKIAEIEALISEINSETGMHLELRRGEPNPFTGNNRMINVKDYIALLGEKSPDLNETAGYHGERLVLLMTRLGLDSCWIGNLPIMEKTVAELKSPYELACIIAFGYGEDHGKPHEGKTMSELCSVEGEMPSWFEEGVRCAMLAPTAINQQKFLFTLLADGRVSATYGKGPYSQVDLGIAKLHFEIGAGRGSFEWARCPRMASGWGGGAIASIPPKRMRAGPQRSSTLPARCRLHTGFQSQRFAVAAFPTIYASSAP